MLQHEGGTHVQEGRNKQAGRIRSPATSRRRRAGDARRDRRRAAQEAPRGKEAPKAKGKAAANAVRVSQAIADFVTGFDLKTVPQPVIDRARAVFIDTVGVMLAGSHEEAAHLVVAMVKAEGSAPQASIVQESLRASPQLAALANGVAAHAMDYDFTYMRAQAIAALIPAILPVAETRKCETTKATPAEIVSAFIIGAEVGAALRARRPGRADVRRLAFDRHGRRARRGGGLRAADAGAGAGDPACDGHRRLAGVGLHRQFRHHDQAAALRQRGAQRRAGGDARQGRLHRQSGGVRGPQRLFPDVRAAASTCRSTASRISAAATISCSGRYRFKPYPCGGLTHTSIEAALELRPRVAGRLDDIKSIHCGVSRAAGQRASTAYPSNTEQAKFSVGYLVPYSLVHGAPRIAAFTDKALARRPPQGDPAEGHRRASIPSSAPAATTARRESASP